MKIPGEGLPDGRLSDEPAADRVVRLLLLLGAGAFVVMLIWLVGR